MCVIVEMMGEESDCSFSSVRRVGGHALARMPWWNCWCRTLRVLMEVVSSCDCSVMYELATFYNIH